MADTSSPQAPLSSDHPVHRQRRRLCDTLESLSDAQWNAETLCEGWDAGDIAAHLLVREREPIPALGILVSPLEPLHDWRMAGRKAKGRKKLLRDLRKGPTILMANPLTRDTQVSEDWIHWQDVVRGDAASADGVTLTPSDGTEDPAVARLLWKALSHYAPMTLRSVDIDGVVDLTDGTTHRTFNVGGAIARAAKGAQADVTVTGPVGELAMFATGRREATVTVDGRDDLVAALTKADRGV